MEQSNSPAIQEDIETRPIKIHGAEFWRKWRELKKFFSLPQRSMVEFHYASGIPEFEAVLDAPYQWRIYSFCKRAFSPNALLNEYFKT